MNAMTDYGFIKIGDMCYCTLPCKHHVIYNGKKSFMNARMIYKLFLKHPEVKTPDHFMYIKDILERESILQETNLEVLKNSSVFFSDIDNILNSALINNRVTICKYILNETKFKLNHNNFINCNDLTMFKYLVSRLNGNISILSETGTNHIGAGGNTICSHAAYSQYLDIIKYLLEDLNVPYPKSNPLMNLKNIRKETETRTYLIQYCVKNNIFITDGLDIGILKDAGMYDIFKNLGLVSNINCVIESTLKYGPVILYNGENKGLTNVKDIKSLTLNIANNNLYREIKQISYHNLKNLETFSFIFPRMYLSVKYMSFKIGSSFKIKEAKFQCNYEDLFKLKVNNNTASISFPEPFDITSAVFTYCHIIFTIDKPRVDTYIKKISYLLDFDEGHELGVDRIYKINQHCYVKSAGGTLMLC
jgi:hypothetical protein